MFQGLGKDISPKPINRFLFFLSHTHNDEVHSYSGVCSKKPLEGSFDKKNTKNL